MPHGSTRRGVFFVSVAEIPPLELLSRDGLGKPEALRAVAVQRAEELHLLLGLDALADDVKAQPFDQMYDLPQKIGAPRVGAAPGQEEFIQLDGVHGDIHHVVQQGTARAKIVQ